MNQENNMGLDNNQQPIQNPVQEPVASVETPQVEAAPVQEQPVVQPQEVAQPVQQPVQPMNNMGQQPMNNMGQPMINQAPVNPTPQPQISNGVNFKNMSSTQKAGAIMIVFTLFAAYSFLTSFGNGVIGIILSFLELAASIGLTILLLLGKKKEATFAALALGGVCLLFTLTNVFGFFKSIYTGLFDNVLLEYSSKYIFPELINILSNLISVIVNALMVAVLGLTALPTLMKKEITEKQKKLLKLASIGLVAMTIVSVLVTVLYVIVATSIFSIYDFGDTLKLGFKSLFFGILRIIFNVSLAVSMLIYNDFDLKTLFKKQA